MATDEITTPEEADNLLYNTILLMKKEMGRMPTEDEIYDFVFGTEEDQARILANSQ